MASYQREEVFGDGYPSGSTAGVAMAGGVRGTLKGLFLGGLSQPVLAAREIAGLALDSPQLWGDLFTHKTLGPAIARCMTFQTVWIILHSSQPSKCIGMWVFLPFLEVFKMAKPTFSVANVVGLLFSKHLARIQLGGPGC